ncbi:hypothetical protein OFD71_32800, partial [Escherichia coli]|nr:hypothetical protein [Escherichia coli]
LKRVTSLLAAKDKREQIASAGSLNLNRYPIQHGCRMPLSKDANLDSKIAFLLKVDQAARAESEYISQFIGSVLHFQAARAESEYISQFIGSVL